MATDTEMDPRFWLRRMFPQSWTDVPAPTATEDWTIAGTNDACEVGFLGTGTLEAPLVIFGDASGGPDTAPP
eukprot:5632850-Pyramimonas_sp.AAC.1